MTPIAPGYLEKCGKNFTKFLPHLDFLTDFLPGTCNIFGFSIKQDPSQTDREGSLSILQQSG
jgi:hypothetical protein